MKKTVSIFVSLLIISMLSGCVSSNDKLGNLNLENTKYIENTPNTGKWQKITFAFPHLCEQSSDRIVNMAAAYGAGEIKKDDIMMQLLDNPEENVPLSDYD